ncbi:hypothetical protein ACFWP5_24400 [Streptomyces sp. NPDC058469]|uniref:hypothetical protein n=1 Tax=Streptomyces sp. NPDC058469 TaxID=3346514 RepID=UPI00365B9CD9
MRAVRRSVSLVLPALFALASCGIPTTGAVEAGGPAGGVVPRVRVYFVADGALVGVLRRTAAPVDVESAVRVLLQGPTSAEQGKRLITMLQLPTPEPTLAASPAATAVPVPQGSASMSYPVRVTSHDDRVSIQLMVPVRRLAGLAAAQLICTALDAQSVGHPGATPLPVIVTGVDGQRIVATGTGCPARS